MNPERLRLFVAVSLPSGHLEALDRAAGPLRSQLGSARWTRPDARHVTLKFLGGTDSALRGDITERLRRVGETHRPAELELGGLGAFPSPNRARVLWVGLDDPVGLLARLAAALDSELAPLGWQPEKRAFTPHLTLARFKTPASVKQVVLEPFDVDAPPFPVDEVVLYRTHLHPGHLQGRGARYEPLDRVALGGQV